MIFEKHKYENLKRYLENLKIQLVMKDKLDGWYIKWLENKIKKTESKIRLKKHSFKDD
jgi:hypothetical protein